MAVQLTRISLRSAHAFSDEMHADQVRRSGKPYVTHPTYVAYILAELGFDQTCAVVALLHDVLEDTLTTQEVLEERFGSRDSRSRGRRHQDRSAFLCPP